MRCPLLPCALALLLLAGAVCGQHLVPLGDQEIINLTTAHNQEWSKVGLHRSGGWYATAWEDGVPPVGIRARFFEFSGAPLTGEIDCNIVFAAGTQDEPMLAMDAAGNVFVAWSDRGNVSPPNDGDLMGCFGVVLDHTGTPLTSDFRINEAWEQSQWEPMPVALPGGGWLVAFNGEDDGDAFLRYFDVDGTPRTGDIRINTFDNNGQTDAVCAVTPGGTVLAAFVDYGGHGGPGTNTNVFARRFDALGNVLDADVFLVNANTKPFEQREPRIAASAGRFIVVWEDWGHDGSGRGIYARMYAETGAPLGPEWLVNTTTAGHQLLPEVAACDAGHFVIVWEDQSAVPSRVVAQVYDAAGEPLGGEVVVNQAPGGGLRPQVSLDAQGLRAVVGFGRLTTQHDVYVRRYAVEVPSATPAWEPRAAGARADGPLGRGSAPSAGALPGGVVLPAGPVLPD